MGCEFRSQLSNSQLLASREYQCLWHRLEVDCELTEVANQESRVGIRGPFTVRDHVGCINIEAIFGGTLRVTKVSRDRYIDLRRYLRVRTSLSHPLYR